MAAFSPEFLNRLSELGNEYQRLSEKHEQLQQQEEQLQQQKQKLQEEVQRLQEGRALLLTENRSLIEKLQEVTAEKHQLQADLDELREDKRAVSLELKGREEEVIKLQQQLLAQSAAHDREILKHNEKHEQLQRENADISEKLKNLNKKRLDLTEQLRLATEEQQRQSEEISSVTFEKQQLLDWKKQQVEESRLLAGRVRTLTARQKQLQEEKQQAVSSLRRQQEEQQLKWERRVRSLEQMRDETLVQLKSLEEEKTRETDECTRQAAEKQQWQAKAAGLEEQLQQTTLELHRVQDALNTERNIVEENKKRHQMEMQDCICRAAEQQNALKQTFAADYRRACDEIERCSREKHHLVESLLEFARAHGCGYYADQPSPDCGDAANISSSRRRSSSRSSGSSTAASPSYQSAAHDKDYGLACGSACGGAAAAPASPSVAGAGAAALGNREQQPTAAEGGNAATDGQMLRLQGAGSETEAAEKRVSPAGVASFATAAFPPSPSLFSSSAAVPATLRLIGARLAALEAAAQAALHEQKRSSEEREALQRTLAETAEKARAAADARHQLAMRFSTVVQGIRELSEKAAFEQQLVRPLLEPPLQRCCTSLSSSSSTSSPFAYPLRSSCSCEPEGGAAPLSSATNRMPAVTEAKRRSFGDSAGSCAPAAALDVHVPGGHGVTQRADPSVHEGICEQHFAGRVRRKEGHGKEERRSVQELLHPAGCSHTTAREDQENHASRDVNHVAGHLVAPRPGEDEGYRIQGGLLYIAPRCSGSESELKPHEEAIAPDIEKESGEHIRASEDQGAFHVYNDMRKLQVDCDTAVETDLRQGRQSRGRGRPQRVGECTEKQTNHTFKSDEFPSTPPTSPAYRNVQSTTDDGFPARENSAEERSNSHGTTSTVTTVPHPSHKALYTHYTSGSWYKREGGHAEGKEETTTDSSQPSTVSGHHSNSSETAFAVFDTRVYTPERVEIAGGYDR